MAVSAFFNNFPKIKYDINNTTVNKQYEDVTNIFFRIRYLREILNNVSSYYVYELEDGDTPEILAEKVYGDAGAGWMIVYANKIMDPQFDWPMDYDVFINYIEGKYGSIATAKTTIHHYEKVITRTNSNGDVTSESRFVVSQSKLTNNNLDVPFDYYDNLPVVQSVNTYEISGETVVEVVKRDAITAYDYEDRINENKRTVKVIKKEYYGAVMTEFNKLTKTTAPYLRRVL